MFVLLRGLELVRPGGVSALLTMRNWMFIKQYAGLRAELLGRHELRLLADLSWGAFSAVPDVKVAISLFWREREGCGESIAIAPTRRSPSLNLKCF